MLKHTNVILSDKFIHEYCIVRGNDCIDNVTTELTQFEYLTKCKPCDMLDIAARLEEVTGHNMFTKWEN